MSSLPHVSVIVPVRNAAATLERCIESLLALDYPQERRELILVDNASTDATPAILASRRRAIRVVREPRRGAAAARNAGLRAATGEIAAFTDADCAVERGWLRSLVAALDGRDNVVVGGAILAARPANRCALFGERIHDHRAAIELFEPPYVITMNCAATLLGALRSARFDERFIRCQDVELSYRLLAAGCSFAFVPDAVVYHRNERTHAGLMREGFQHGFHAVAVRRAHSKLLTSPGRRSVRPRALARRLAAAAGRRARSTPELAFVSGKALGNAAGTIRFRYLSR